MNDKFSNNRIAKNTIFLYVRMILILVIGLYTSRVILNELGVSDFGVYNVIAGFVSLFSFLNTTLASSVQRYYNYIGGQLGDAGYTKVFSVGLRIHIILAILVLLLLEIVGVWYVNNRMIFPNDRLIAANVVFQLSAISLIFVILQVPYCGAILAKERMDFYALVSIIEVSVRLILVILLPYIPFDKLIVYALVQFIVTILSFFLYIIYSRKNFKFLYLTKDIDKSLLNSLLSFSGWNLMGSFAFVFKGNGVNLLLNSFFGPIVNAARGIAAQISGAVMGFSTNVSIAFRPQLVGAYAVGDIQRTYSLFLSQSKICYCLMLMIITPVIIEMNYLLTIWLGNSVPEYTNMFASLVLFDALINTLNAPVTQVVYATGNIKQYQIVSGMVNILLIPVCWILLKLGFTPISAFVLTIVFSIICQVGCLVVMHAIFKFKYMDYIKRVIYPCIIMTLLVPLFPVLFSVLIKESFIRLLVVCLTSVLVTSILLYAMFLTQQEKELLKVYIHKIFRRIA